MNVYPYISSTTVIVFNKKDIVKCKLLCALHIFSSTKRQFILNLNWLSSIIK